MALALSASAASAQAPCEPVVGRLASAAGRVEIQRDETASWLRGELDAPLCQGDSVRVAEHSRATVALINDSVIRIDEGSTVRLVQIVDEPEEASLLDLILGAFQSFSRRPTVLAVNTPYLNATIEGTEFVVRVTAAGTDLTVLEGRVAAANEQGRVSVAQGEAVSAAPGQAPQSRVVARPRDAVHWSLYYPPILAGLSGEPGQAPADLAEALGRHAQGDVPGALAALERVPAGRRDARFHLYRAAILLSVGRVDQARPEIDRALEQDPASGTALALRSVIRVVQNETDQALADAAKAVELSPDEAATRIAHSYALQAKFRLEEARDTLLAAVEANPESALAQARLAEIWLTLGYRGRAHEAADKAVALAPDLARTQTVLGFAALTEFRTTTARGAFERAIALAGDDPLPRLGLGLAKIRDGALEAGRDEIDVAVALDANNALLRAYLGKAYFEEKRNELAAQQLEIAKQIDPNDPTAYLYDAIRKQSENRPGEALDDLQASIERNDNRAVYRSRQQLDQDRAARGTSLARAYDDLGFQQLGVNEASKSLALAPDDAAAHRFLSDNLSGTRRREIARVSELLQAQMLQDININPVQPSISETSLNIASRGGPAEAGFNEFTPLFERNQFQLNGSALMGSHDTQAGEVVGSALYDRFSISAGAFHYVTDGFRDNHEIKHEVYNVFAQAALTPDLNIQTEFRRRNSDQGDLALNFDPDDFSSTFNRNLEQDTARVGLRYSPWPGNDLLLSYIYNDRDVKQTDNPPCPFPSCFGFPVIDEIFRDQTGHQVEGQYIYRQDLFNLTAGGAYSAVDGQRDRMTTVSVFPLLDITEASKNKHGRGYIYGNVNFPSSATWTLGFSYDDYEQQEFEKTDFNHKFGVQWDVTDSVTLRGAAFKVVKPALVNNRSLEPTQVAGFNQLFDDINATETWFYGAGADWRITADLAVGAEATWRFLDEPVDIGSEAQFEDREEQRHRAYLYWTPIDEVALSSAFVYDRYEADDGVVTASANLPEKAVTYSVPLGIRLFSPSGFFLGLTGTWVHQDIERAPTATQAEGDDSFFVADASVGFRFPNQLGMASFAVTNILDKKFKYQDDSYREFRDEPSSGPYFPERAFLVRLTLNF